jgi:hypothetical protein
MAIVQRRSPRPLPKARREMCGLRCHGSTKMIWRGLSKPSARAGSCRARASRSSRTCSLRPSAHPQRPLRAVAHPTLLALGVGAGDVVLTVSHSFIAAANVVRMCGAEPVFVDIDPVSFNVSPAAVEYCLDHYFERRDGAL